VTSLGVQVHGGMGFIEETGAAQYYRDARILPIYEGTNGIQANDLAFRKVARDGGAAAHAFADEVAAIEASLVAAIGAAAALIRWPAVIGLLFAPVVVAVGLWAWYATRLAGRSALWAAAWAGGTLVACAVALPAMFTLFFESEPRVTDAAPITKEDRVRLEQMLKIAGESVAEPVELHFTASDLTGIAAAWLGARSSPSKAIFSGDADHLRCEVTYPLFSVRSGASYLNVIADMKPSVRAGRIDPGVTSLRIGQVRVPAILAAHLSGPIGKMLDRVPEAFRLASAIDELSFAGGSMVVVTDPDHASSAFADSMTNSSGASERMRSDIREIMRSVVDECGSLPSGDERFSGLVQAAFRIAQRRTQGDDASEQNKAAIVALGIQIGDPRLRRFVGFPASEEMIGFAWDFDDRTTLHGRNDLARHFLVSAALRALSTKDIGMTMGLFKEQLDAVDGGSGFSFTDIAADMAGLRFAEQAIDPRRAARLQRRVQEDASVESLLPSLDGLSDNLSQNDFNILYGSPTDDRYRAVIRVIDHRMEACPHLATERFSESP
jgi:hypothetical protein